MIVLHLKGGHNILKDKTLLFPFGYTFQKTKKNSTPQPSFNARAESICALNWMQTVVCPAVVKLTLCCFASCFLHFDLFILSSEIMQICCV